MILLLGTAIAYFYFNWTYFDLVKKLEPGHKRPLWLVFLSFFVNYMFFFLCSVLEFPLVVNWFLFAFLLLFETLLYNGKNKRFALFATLLGILYGLAVNIACRSIAAIMMNQSLQRFDNHTVSTDNLKGVPVLLGFLFAGVVLQMMGSTDLLKRIRMILNHPREQLFLLEMMAGLFFYLFLNLLLYSTHLNDFILKVWSIKSCLFCVIAFYIAARYARRVCELSDYREKNRQMEREIDEKRREEEQLRQQASLDVLTGLYNRQYAEETVASVMEQERGFTICFLDLDGLKNVNDRYGHQEGDSYIRKATEQIRRACREGDALFRYGGDEFLILFDGMTVEAAEKRAETINDGLIAIQGEAPFSYPMSLSYGVAESCKFIDWKALIEEADHKMYIQKQNKKMARD